MSDAYEPNDDSLFLSKIVTEVHAERVVEVGVGSGFVIAEYVEVNAPELAVGTDLDVEAIKVAQKRRGHDSVDYICCRSCDAFRMDVFQLVFFNPPYLKDEKDYDAATSGGEKGVERTCEMAFSSYWAMAPRGRMLFLASSLSDIGYLLRRLQDEGMEPKRLATCKLFFEELFAFEVRKDSFSRRSRSRRR